MDSPCTKRCSTCKETKERSQFFNNRWHTDGKSHQCKSCAQISNRRGLKTFSGHAAKMYFNILSRLNFDPSYKGRTVHFTKGEFLEWILNDPTYTKLHTQWVESDYSKKLTPTLDRIENHGQYEMGNIQVLTKSENSRKERVKPVVIDGVEYGSIKEASEMTGTDPKVISDCCKGKREAPKGMSFAFRDSK